MDYIGIKVFGENGELTGERRFVGLFTSRRLPPTAGPRFRCYDAKSAHVMAGSGLLPDSHDGKALQHILDTFPRDELFQISEEELLSTALGILNLGERPKVRLFLRFDRFDRYVSALVFIPRERYSGAVRENVHAILGQSAERAHVRRDTDARRSKRLRAFITLSGAIPVHVLRSIQKNWNRRIRAAVRTWDDDFTDAARAAIWRKLRRHSSPLWPCISGELSRPFSPHEAAGDIAVIEQVLNGRAAAAGVTAKVYARPGDAADQLRLKLFVGGEFIPLSDCLPVFENLGLKVIAEAAFALNPALDSASGTHLTSGFCHAAPGIRRG